MSQEQKEKFEQIFQNAVTSSLRGTIPCDSVRSRLLTSLAAVGTRAPESVSEEDFRRFETSLVEAVARSQEWAVDDALALRVENQVSLEAQRDLLSERSVQAEFLSDEAASSDKARFLKGLRGAVHRSQRQVVAPELCRRRIEAAFKAERRVGPSKSRIKAEVVAFPQRNLWRQGLTAAASVAAGFALIFITLFGSAEKALANSVRRDHVKCCAAAKKAEGKRGDRPVTPMSETRYGKIPTPPIDPSWTLVASRVCRSETGTGMIHNLYRRGDETLSLHFLPPDPLTQSMADTELREVGDDDFPVFAYEKSGWTVTACSPDLKLEDLRAVVSQR